MWIEAAIITTVGVVHGLLLGARDGAAQRARAAMGTDQARHLNEVWHYWGWATKTSLIPVVGTLLWIPTHPVLGSLLFGAALGVAFHVGHNLEQGKSLTYFGTYAPSDNWIHASGASATGIAVLALTILIGLFVLTALAG